MKPVAGGKMFAFRLTSYQVLQCLLIFFVSSEVIAGGALKKCAAVNEYCLYHWDCCSNTCMNYLYRCGRGYGQDSYPYPFLGVNYKPSVTLDDILEQNFGRPNQPSPYFISRFSPAADVAADVVATETTMVPKKTEESGSEAKTPKNIENLFEGTTLLYPIDEKEASSVTEQFLDASTSKTSVDERPQITATPHDQSSQGITEIARDNTTEATIKRSTEKASCADIGQKCYSGEECCSRLCHGYLHQCVT